MLVKNNLDLLVKNKLDMLTDEQIKLLMILTDIDCGYKRYCDFCCYRCEFVVKCLRNKIDWCFKRNNKLEVCFSVIYTLRKTQKVLCYDNLY